MQLLNRGSGTDSAVVDATESHLASTDVAIFCQARLLLPGITTAVRDFDAIFFPFPLRSRWVIIAGGYWYGMSSISWQ